MRAAIVNTLINAQLRVDEAKLKARQSDELLPKLLKQLKIEQERISKIPFRRTLDVGEPIAFMPPEKDTSGPV